MIMPHLCPVILIQTVGGILPTPPLRLPIGAGYAGYEEQCLAPMGVSQLESSECLKSYRTDLLLCSRQKNREDASTIPHV